MLIELAFDLLLVVSRVGHEQRAGWGLSAGMADDASGLPAAGGAPEDPAS